MIEIATHEAAKYAEKNARPSDVSDPKNLNRGSAYCFDATKWSPTLVVWLLATSCIEKVVLVASISLCLDLPCSGSPMLAI